MESRLLKRVDSKCKFFFQNQMSVIICRWKLEKHLDCFRDNRKLRDTRKKIKLCGLNMCSVTFFRYSISHKVLAFKLWYDESEDK